MAAPDHRRDAPGRGAPGLRAGVGAGPLHLHDLLIGATGASRAAAAARALLGSLASLLLGGCGSETVVVTPPEQLGLTAAGAAVPECVDVGLPSPPLGPVDTVAAGLEVPWDLAFLPDGRILLTERPGRMRVVDPTDGLRAEPWAALDVPLVAEAGLLGLDVQAGRGGAPRVYVFGTYLDVPTGRLGRMLGGIRRRTAGLLGGDPDDVWRNRVVVLEDRAGSGVAVDTVVASLPAGPVHAGGALRFGPDGLLYLGLGEGGNPPAAQDPETERGKLLRLDPAGSAAAGNPVQGSAVFASGLRNVQGVAWDPITGALLAVDHGPTGLEREGYRAGQDELNRVVPGANFGWPLVSGSWEGQGLTAPLVEWTPAIAPAGITFVDAPRSAWHGDAIVAGLVGNTLVRVVFARGASGVLRVTCREALFPRAFGRLRAVRSSPDGYLYFTTSNRDQRGTPRQGDDLLLRVRVPPGS